MSKARETFMYFAYGSNLLSKRIHLNNRTAVMKAVALLQDYKLDFGYMSQRWKGAAANIVPQPGSQVYGVLWEICTSDLANLDRQEGVADNIYERVELTVETMDGEKVACKSYKILEETRRQAIEQFGSTLLPSLRYKNVIINGAKEHNLPEFYAKYLQSIPDNGYDGEVDVNLPLLK